MSASHDSRFEITPEILLQALKNDEFFMVYQPQVNAGNGRLVGFESLIRWQHPKQGLLPPDDFIPVFESGPQVHDLWDYILKRVAEDRQKFDDLSHGFLHIALNLSAAQLPEKTLGNNLRQWMETHDIEGSQVHIEITESALISESPQIIDNLNMINSLGISIWLDDFGTGHSSLKHLRDLPIQGVKIDKSFVDGIESNLPDFRIVSAIIAMSNSLGLKVVAEGIETENQAQILTQLGCDTLQGYFISKPDTMDAFEHTWLAIQPSSTGVR